LLHLLANPKSNDALHLVAHLYWQDERLEVEEAAESYTPQLQETAQIRIEKVSFKLIANSWHRRQTDNSRANQAPFLATICDTGERKVSQERVRSAVPWGEIKTDI
jgi:hypothetical protein